MYVGHLGPALGGKRLAPSVALVTLVIATYLPDWVDAALCLGGRYHGAQMYSDSIPAMSVRAILAGDAQVKDADKRGGRVGDGGAVTEVMSD
mgnify:CR=1 FL=1